MRPAFLLRLMLAPGILTSGVLLAAPVVLAAQGPAHQAMLGAWEDSVAQVTSIDALAPLDQLSRVRGMGAVGDLRREIFLIRQAMLKENRPDFELALDNLSLTAAKHRSWGWPEYLIAKIFVAMAEARMPVTVSTGQLPLESFTDAVWRHLKDAAHADPSFVRGRQYLVSLMAAGAERELRPDQATALAEEIARPDPVPDAFLVSGRQLRRESHYAEAVQAFERSAALGGDPSQLALERARTVRVMGDTANALRLYWTGVQRLTPVGRAAYRTDLAWFVEPKVLAGFDQLPDDSLVPWLEHFWEQRDADVAGKPGQRLLSQLMRWSYVFGRFNAIDAWKSTMYSAPPSGFESGLNAMRFGNGSGPAQFVLLDTKSFCGQSSVPDFFRQLWALPPLEATDIRLREPIIDQRGILYLRHGEPIRRLVGRSVLPSDTALFFAGNDPYRDREVRAAIAARTKRGQRISSGFGAKETWLYLVDGAYRALELAASAAMGGYGPTTIRSYVEYNPSQWGGLAEYLPLYSTGAVEIEALPAWSRRMPGTGRDATPCLHQVQNVLKRGRADSKVVIATESKAPPIVHPWAAATLAFALGTGSTKDAVGMIALGFGGPFLRPDPDSSGRTVYSIAFHLEAYQASSGRSVSLDTTRHFSASAPLRNGQSLAATFELPLDAGSWQVAVRAGPPDVDSIGLYALIHNVVIPESGTLALSDIIPGVAGGAHWLATDGAVFPVNVFGTWHAGATAELFYEVQGIPDGVAYQTTLEVRSANPKVKQFIRLVSTERASGAVTHVRKALDLQQLPAGEYRVTVTADHAGQRATRVRALTIVKP